MFFDEYPRFTKTSRTANSMRRLNLRHEAIIEQNRHLLDGARVLDLASHDGRWSFAAFKAGAAHVTGVEARKELVDNAHCTFAGYGVPNDRYTFIQGDMFRILRRRQFDVDVVLCLGFVYHTLRYQELFRGIRDATPSHLLLDTKVALDDRPVIELKVNRTMVQANAAADEFSHGSRALAGWPSLPALLQMLETYDIDVESQVDWPALMARHEIPLAGYGSGQRVTLRCRVRADSRARQHVPRQGAVAVEPEPARG